MISFIKNLFKKKSSDEIPLVPLTRRINFFAGPNSGKSTIAARLFAEMKMLHFDVELVREYIKIWVYEKKVPKGFDQYYIFNKQMRSEYVLLSNNVGTIITDSPLILQLPYCERDNLPGWRSLLVQCIEFEKSYPSLNIFLDRTGVPYSSAGRYQSSEDEAIILDGKIESFLIKNNIEYHKCPTLDYDKIKELVIRSI